MSGTKALDPRIMRFVLNIGGQTMTYTDNGTGVGLYMSAKGTKFANAIQNQCTIQIGNLTLTEKNFLLSECSPYNQNTSPKTMEVYAGRVSTGFSLVFAGDVTNCNVTQPPDILTTLKSATGQALKSYVRSVSGGKTQKFSAISAGVAQRLGLGLKFEATDKSIANYGYSGSQLKEVSKLGSAGNVNAYIDDNMLVVKNNNSPLQNITTVVSMNEGMVGVPELTEEGVKLQFLFNNSTTLGGAVKLTSEINPTLNGLYTIAKLEFDLTNREAPFYYTATCVNPQLSPYLAAAASANGG